ncbi:MAG TPA: ATP-binding protein [Acetobacteraceae bacterium]|jgi:signal transduction histidine kinase|nr:ATP-binding protein [Acetobacteraceae bacterium]
MMWFGILAVVALLVALWLWAALRVLRVAHAGVAAREVASEARAAGATRLLRLSAQELRDLGVRLHGHADHVGVGGALAAELGAASAQLLEIADELQDRALPASGARTLREERLELIALAAEAVAAAAALLAPGRRHWRMPEAAAAWLWADRRALRHVLGRVLADAVRNTRNDDWIEIALRPVADGVALVVEDEGVGFAASGAGGGVALAADSRGIGLRLALARSLMEAHGGRLEVEALAKVGSRISLIFPAARLRPESSE